MEPHIIDPNQNQKEPPNTPQEQLHMNNSPSHEFSFTISFHPPPPAAAAATSSAAAIDLSPADDIFFHGHLLPLHLLSDHSPRPSNISIDTIDLPLQLTPATAAAAAADQFVYRKNNDDKEKRRIKSFYTLLTKWLGNKENKEAEKRKRRTSRMFEEAMRILKKYISIVEPLLLSFKGSSDAKEKRDDFRRQQRRPYSFSGRSSNARDKFGGRREGRGRRGEVSAPASMRTSPANSGLLVPAPTLYASSDDSTMEELQNAIQAAIAHCKSSVTMKEEINKDKFGII